MSDWAMFPLKVTKQAIAYMEKYPDRKFLCQTKDPLCFDFIEFPPNAILGVTIETNRRDLIHRISFAPQPEARYRVFRALKHPHKIVIIEPILKFDLYILAQWVKEINPIRVYIGHDSKRCRLEEPSMQEVLRLKEELEGYSLKVIDKGIRKAWWKSKEAR